MLGRNALTVAGDQFFQDWVKYVVEMRDAFN